MQTPEGVRPLMSNFAFGLPDQYHTQWLWFFRLTTDVSQSISHDCRPSGAETVVGQAYLDRIA